MSHKIDCLECFIQGELQGEKTGALVELERIIKLLEENYPNRLAGVIALIKGEK